MNVTEVRLKLMPDGNERLCAFCSIVFDDVFVVHDLKIIMGTTGLFIAMPSHKITDRCPACGGKNHVMARFCNDCGIRLGQDRAMRDANGQAKIHIDKAHPINTSFRNVLQEVVLRHYERECNLARQPGYVSQFKDGNHASAVTPES